MQKYENHISFHEYPDMEIIQGECNHSFPAHIHESLCVGCITEGRAVFSINGHTRILSSGEYYVIPPYTIHALSSVAFEKFCYHIICFKNFTASKEFYDSVASAKSYIEHTTSAFNIDTLSRAVHVSKYHLDRIFKEQIGITPYQFYINNRIKKVRQGLQSHVPLSDMVFDLNFSDQSHLCNTFRKHVGISPTQYAHSYQYN